MNLSRYFNGRLNLGIPVTNRGRLKDSWILHFYLQSNLF